jgi:hypothetical protein
MKMNSCYFLVMNKVSDKLSPLILILLRRWIKVNSIGSPERSLLAAR